MKIVEIKSDVQALKEDLQEMLEIGGAMMRTVTDMCECMDDESEEGHMGMRHSGRRTGRRMSRRGSGYPSMGGYSMGRHITDGYDPDYDD